ncbi:MAG: Asp-tRNA(Asn)/Glu-tRNA(Gln) amidotransferase subunit GatC [Rhodospirillaceae bacterium]|nr:Asp-tRNA(Asn)/Glu-tRNA(Gln) amidotransferase subunit GatC [Rhodospirillaceae bacterium]
MSLDEATIRRIATLARIEVPQAELEATAAKLSGILNWIEQLNEVNTDNVAPMSGGTVSGGTDLTLPWRTDVVTDGDQQEMVLANAPEAHAGFFAVPKVVE